MIRRFAARIWRGPDPAYRVADPGTEDVDRDEQSPFLNAWPGPAPTVADLAARVAELRAEVSDLTDQTSREHT